MIPMEYREFIRILFRRWWLIVLPVVLSAVTVIPDLIGDQGGGSAGFTTQIRYSAAQRRNMPDRDGDYQDVWLASQHTVDALTDWVRTASFRGEIRDALGEKSVSLDSLQIAADNARSVGVVYMSHANHEALGAIAEAAVLALSNHSQRYFPQLGGEAAQVTILEPPALSAAPPALSSRLAPLIRLGVALLIGLAIAIFAEFVDPTIYHGSDLRRMGLPLLGSIPKERA
jgi:capsular polysaccharide biosynthesis protein